MRCDCGKVGWRRKCDAEWQAKRDTLGDRFDGGFTAYWAADCGLWHLTTQTWQVCDECGRDHMHKGPGLCYVCKNLKQLGRI